MRVAGGNEMGRPSKLKTDKLTFGAFLAWINPIRVIRDSYRWSQFKTALKEQAESEEQKSFDKNNKYKGNSVYAKVNRLRRGVNQCNDYFEELQEVEKELQNDLSEWEDNWQQILNLAGQLFRKTVGKPMDLSNDFKLLAVTRDRNILASFCRLAEEAGLGNDPRLKTLQVWVKILQKQSKAVQNKLEKYFPTDHFLYAHNISALEDLQKALKRQRLSVQLAERQMRYEVMRVYRQWRRSGTIPKDVYCPEFLEANGWMKEFFPRCSFFPRLKVLQNKVAKEEAPYEGNWEQRQYTLDCYPQDNEMFNWYKAQFAHMVKEQGMLERRDPADSSNDLRKLDGWMRTANQQLEKCDLYAFEEMIKVWDHFNHLVECYSYGPVRQELWFLKDLDNSAYGGAYALPTSFYQSAPLYGAIGGALYPPGVAPYPPQVAPYPPQAAPYPPRMAPYPPQVATYLPQAAPYPPRMAPYPPAPLDGAIGGGLYVPQKESYAPPSNGLGFGRALVHRSTEKRKENKQRPITLRVNHPKVKFEETLRKHERQTQADTEQKAKSGAPKKNPHHH